MEFKRYSSFDALVHSKDQWNHLVENSPSHVPFLTFDYQKAWWKTRGGGEWRDESELVLVAGYENQKLMGIVPLFHTDNLMGQKALMFVGSIEVSDFLDFIARPDDLEEFVFGAIGFLLQEETLPHWQVLDLYNILENSHSLVILEAIAKQRGWAFEKVHLQPSPYIPLPGDYETYLASIDKKQRHEIRRKIRNVEQNLVQSQVYFVEDGRILQAETQSFIDLMAQDPNKRGFLTEAMQKHIHNTAQAAFENGWLQLAFLTLDGEKAAANLSFKFDNRLWLYNSGWEWKFRDYSPGWVLLAHLIEWATKHGFEEFDFMRGDEPYKYKFGGVDRNIYRMIVTPNN